MHITEEKIILQEYKKAFKDYSHNKVIDLDRQLSRIGCFLIRMEDLLPENGFEVPPYRQSRFVILYISEGEGKKKIGSSSFPIKDNTLIIIPSRITTSSQYHPKVKGFYFSFNLTFFLQKEFPRHYLLNIDLFNPQSGHYVYLNSQAGKKMNEIFSIIESESKHMRKNKEDLLMLKVLELILLSDRLFNNENPKAKVHHPPVLIKYIDLVQDQYKEQHSPGYYAKQLHTHPNALNALAQRHLGQSAKSIVDTKLIAEAKYLLQQTKLSVKEVAYELGFNSPSQFFRFFKRCTRHSPTRYRTRRFDFAVN